MSLRKTITLICGLSLMHSSFAREDLMDIYYESVTNDTIIQQARAQYLSAKEAIPQARAELFPDILVAGNIQRQKDQVSANVPIFLPEQIYNSHNYNISLSQPVFNMQAWYSVKTAKETVKQAAANYAAAQQNLMIRVAESYFDVLLARDTLEFQGARKRANKRQLDQAEQRFKVGLDAITSVYEARAAHDLSVADEIAGRNDLENKRESLRNLIGRKPGKIASLRNDNIPLAKPYPSIVTDWVDTSLAQNYALQASKYAKQAAEKNIKVQTVGNFPVLDITTFYNDRGSNAGGFAGAFTTTRAAALELTFPVFQGGSTISRMHQAGFDYQNASAKFEQDYRAIIVNTRQSYNNVIAGISKIQADRQAVVSAEKALESTTAQVRVGTRTMVDVLISQQRLFEAQTQLARDQYAYLLDSLLLKELAGILSEDDLENINRLLKNTQRYANATPAKDTNTTAITTANLDTCKQSLPFYVSHLCQQVVS